jgi:hypothetical protein
LQRLLDAPNREENQERRFRDRAILELLFSTGLRVAELCSLGRDLDLKLEVIDWSDYEKFAKNPPKDPDEILNNFVIEFQNYSKRRDRFEVTYLVHGKTLLENKGSWKMQISK